MRLRPLIGISFVALAAAAQAQKLPPPTRDVYRCEADGKVTYSDAPCLGAKKVDVEPTRGLNASTGRERVGKDVQRERLNEQLAEAVRPITGKDARQLDTQAKRLKLTASAQRECRGLDQEIPVTEARERNSSGNQLRTVQQQLLLQRQRFIALGC